MFVILYYSGDWLFVRIDRTDHTIVYGLSRQHSDTSNYLCCQLAPQSEFCKKNPDGWKEFSADVLADLSRKVKNAANIWLSANDCG